MEHSRRPARRDGRRQERNSNKIRPVKEVVPTDDSPLALMRAQLERVDAQRAELERVLAGEKDARAAEARELGEMMARVSQAEGRAHAAQSAAEELAAKLEEERRLASEREARQALVRTELESLRAEAKRWRTDAPPRSMATGDGGDDTLRRELEASRAEARRMRESLEALQKRAAHIGAGLKEMRELMLQSATLFDELEERERAIGEIRAKSLAEARTLFLRAAGKGEGAGVPPPLPVDKAIMEDLSEAAELLEEEVRASMRPRHSR
jgi:chemosensory pili system protein ChpA (sensor histidine kinase/response regulator)